MNSSNDKMFECEIDRIIGERMSNWSIPRQGYFDLEQTSIYAKSLRFALTKAGYTINKVKCEIENKMDNKNILYTLGFTLATPNQVGPGWTESNISEIPPSLRDWAGDELVSIMKETKSRAYVWKAK